MNAYKEIYLNNAANTFGCMMDYAVNDCGLDGDVFCICLSHQGWQSNLHTETQK